MDKLENLTLEVEKAEFTRRLIFLNDYIRYLKNELKKYDKITDEYEKTSDKITELYSIKQEVLIKMVADGYATIKELQVSNYKNFYVVRLNREFTFHIVADKKTRKICENAKSKTVICPNNGI